MMSSIVFSSSDRGKKPYNQDIWGVNSGIAWVFDGATNLFESQFTEDDVHYAMSILNKCLKSLNPNTVSLENFLKSAIRQAESKILAEYPEFFDVEPHLAPTFALCIIAIHESSIEYIILGDCFLEVCQNNSFSRISDDRFREISKRNNAEIAKLDKFSPFYHESVLEIYRNTRANLNKPNGYWIGSFDLMGLDKSINGEFFLETSASVAIYSDGLIAGLGEDNFLHYPCEFEGDDAIIYKQRFNRIKSSDDKTAVVLKVWRQ